MKVLLVNTAEKIGGAAVAAGRLMRALRKQGVDARMLVRDKQTEDARVTALSPSLRHRFNFVWERVVIWIANRFSRNNLFAVDIACCGTDITSLPEFKEADIIHLHWINQGMLSLQGIRRILASGKPVVWTMHDMWPCTGICHHARGGESPQTGYHAGCTAYQTQCGHCPYIYKGGSRHDLSCRIFRKKRSIYRDHALTFVACSHWLESLAQSSALIKGQKIVNVPNPIDTELFRPSDKQAARRALGLPENRQLLLFGSVKVTDKRKGIDYLVEACRLIAQQKPELTGALGVVIFGNNSQELQSLLPFTLYPLGYIKEEEKLVSVYNAVDTFVTPSLEENLPNMIMEAMACGVPCVGFRTGGIPEMIDHLHNGYVADYRSTADLADGMLWNLQHPHPETLSLACRAKVESCYSESVVAGAYMNLYQQAQNHEE
jgi:glycosyltransferase involved in cell wall biosynthesis